MIRDPDRAAIGAKLAALKNNVRLAVFTQELECEYCTENRLLAEEIAQLSDKLSVEVYNFVIDKQKADEYGIDKIPATAIIGKKDYGVRIFGIPAGYEFASLLEALERVSSGESGLSVVTKSRLAKLAKPVHMQVFATPT